MNAQVPLPAPPATAPPAFVLGGVEDKVVDTQAVEVRERSRGRAAGG